MSKNRKIDRYTFVDTIQIATFICGECNVEKTENWAIKEYPFYICNECKSALQENEPIKIAD